MKSAYGPLLICLTLVGAMGVVHGIYSDRWGPSTELEEAVARLSKVPMTIGDWSGKDFEIDPGVHKAAGIEAGIVRRYRNAKTGEEVSVLLVCGRGGPISVHTPDVCYGGAGYVQLAPEKPKTVELSGGRTGTFNVARFGKPGVDPGQLEIYWGWSLDGANWQAPENPRLSLARSRALYKFYVVREYFRGIRAENAKTCETFLQNVEPELRKDLASIDH